MGIAESVSMTQGSARCVALTPAIYPRHLRDVVTLLTCHGVHVNADTIAVLRRTKPSPARSGPPEPGTAPAPNPVPASASSRLDLHNGLQHDEQKVAEKGWAAVIARAAEVKRAVVVQAAQVCWCAVALPRFGVLT